MTRFRRSALSVAILSLGASAMANGDDDPLRAVNDEPSRSLTDTFHSPTRLKAADRVIDSGEFWGHSSPWVEDVDGDGLRDLVVGDFSGFFRVYRNVGTNQTPKYAASVNLQADNADAHVPIS